MTLIFELKKKVQLVYHFHLTVANLIYCINEILYFPKENTLGKNTNIGFEREKRKIKQVC